MSACVDLLIQIKLEFISNPSTLKTFFRCLLMYMYNIYHMYQDQGGHRTFISISWFFFLVICDFFHHNDVIWDNFRGQKRVLKWTDCNAKGIFHTYFGG